MHRRNIPGICKHAASLPDLLSSAVLLCEYAERTGEGEGVAQVRRGMSIFIQALGTERQQAEGQAFASPSRSKFDTNVLQLSLLPLGVRTVIYSQKNTQSLVSPLRQPVGPQLYFVFHGSSVCPLTTALSCHQIILSSQSLFWSPG